MTLPVCGGETLWGLGTEDKEECVGRCPVTLVHVVSRGRKEQNKQKVQNNRSTVKKISDHVGPKTC